MPILTKKLHKCLLFALMVSSSLLSAQGPLTSESEVKAVFVFNLTQFVEWPSASFSSPQTPLVIGVFGENPFGTFLENAVAGENVHGHPLVVYYYKNPEEAKLCQVLFISRSRINDISTIMANINGKSILTISDAPDFMQKGGMVRLYNKNNKINIQINLDAAKTAKLDVSSKLLRLCEIYAPY